MNRFLTIFFIATIYFGCNSEDSNSNKSEGYLRGKKIYKSVCISCHSVDPRKQGPLAPPIAGSELEVIKSMVMTGKHPKGVQPKWPERDREMEPLPHLEDEIPHLYEYLKSFN